MKRQQERETQTKSKRSRMGYGGPDSADIERLSPENDRREGRGSRPKTPRDREMREHRDRDRDHDIADKIAKRHKDDRILDNPYVERRNPGPEYPEYRTICITNLNTQVPDGLIREALSSEFEKFGDFNIKVVRHGDHRMAYLNFRHPEDAKSAKHLRGKIILFDRTLRIDSVYHHTPKTGGWQEKRRRSSSSPPPRGLPAGDYGKDVYQNRGLSPPPRMNRPRHNSLARDNQPREREYQNFDSRRQHGEPQRFPHHLQHIDPEDDVNATRTLFVGKLDNNIEEEELRDVFSHYGIVEEIDIKRPQNKGPGTAYAFVKFFNLDMAHRAKVEMSGQYIGKFQCKIGYGKATATTCLWVGGLGPWIRPESLEREFDRFGVINRIEWPQSKNFAFVLYDSLDAAQAACQEMRGFPLGGPDRRIKMDFADLNHLTHPPLSPPKGHLEDRPDMFMGPSLGVEREHPGFDNQWPSNRGFNGNRRGNGRRDFPGPNEKSSDNLRNMNHESFRRDDVDWLGDDQPDHRTYGKLVSSNNERTFQSNVHLTNEYTNSFPMNVDNFDRHALNHNRDHSPGKRHQVPFPHNQQHGRGSALQGQLENGRSHAPEASLLQLASVDHVENLPDLAKCLPVVWSGALVLKNSAFAARMHLLCGEVNLVDNLMRDPTTTEMPVLRIMQRLRLDQTKLEEVSRRISGAGPSGHSILLAMPGSAQALEDSNTNIQQRPLRNLMSYLKQKDAAGVITLPPNPTGKDNHGILYAFPPCKFAHDFLQKRAPKLATNPCKEDHLLVFVVKTDGPLTI